MVQHPYLWVVAGWSACIHRFWRFVFPSYFTLDLRPPDISLLCVAYGVKLCTLSWSDFSKLSSLLRFSQPFASFHQYQYFLLLHNLRERRKEKKAGVLPSHSLTTEICSMFEFERSRLVVWMFKFVWKSQIWQEKSNHQYQFSWGSTISSLIFAFVVQLRLRGCVKVKHKYFSREF